MNNEEYLEKELYIEIEEAKQRNEMMKVNDILADSAIIDNDIIKVILKNGIEISAPLSLVDMETEYGETVEIINSGTLYFPKNDEYMSVEGLVLQIISSIPGCIVSHKNR